MYGCRVRVVTVNFDGDSVLESVDDVSNYDTRRRECRSSGLKRERIANLQEAQDIQWADDTDVS